MSIKLYTYVCYEAMCLNLALDKWKFRGRKIMALGHILLALALGQVYTLPFCMLSKGITIYACFVYIWKKYDFVSDICVIFEFICYWFMYKFK